MSCCKNDNSINLDQRYVLKIELDALRNELKKIDRTRTVSAIQSGKNGDIIPVGTDHTIHLDYEGWVESHIVDATGAQKIASNDSSNAVSAAAVSEALRGIRKEILAASQGFAKTHVTTIPSEEPVVERVIIGDIYLVPSENGYKEFIAIESGDLKQPYKWELIGEQKDEKIYEVVADAQKKLGELTKVTYDLAEAVKRSNDARMGEIAAISERLDKVEKALVPKAGEVPFTKEQAGQLKLVYEKILDLRENGELIEEVDVSPILKKIKI